MAEERVQRRLAAILAADVVGYSRLMERDETGTLGRLKSLRSEVFDPTTAQFNGRIFKNTGDGALAEFGSAVDAVQCAVEIQRTLARRNDELPEDMGIILRIGISLGDVIVEGDDLYGNGVNIAARMEGLAEPGEICVSGNVHEHMGNSLDVTFEDLGEQAVKNIDRPVRSYRVNLEAPAVSENSPQQASTPARSDSPSIAVLPFDNMSGDAEQDYFSDGMAEDLITDLSKISNLSVAARNSSFSFKGQLPDVRDVAEKLGVKFVLEGSVRKMGDRLRINAQLIGAADGTHIWADRYDGDMSEIFEFQDRIRDEIVAALKLKLTAFDEERSGRKQTANFEAYDLFLRGRAAYYRYTPETLLVAEDYLTKAIEAEPNLTNAYAYLSRCLTGRWIHNWPGSDATLDRAIEFAERAVDLDKTSALGFVMLAFAQNFDRQFENSETNFERAIVLNPNDPEVYGTYAGALVFWGDHERTLEILDRVHEIDPIGHPNADFLYGQCQYLTGKFDAAAATLTQVIGKQSGFIPARLHLIAALAETERLEEARVEIKELLAGHPLYSVADADRIYPYKLEREKQQFLDGLRRAGLPEGDTSAEEHIPLSLPDKPSIAVLPFVNMSDDPEQEYFADGISEDIITALSRFHWFFVIARNSSFSYKGTSPDIRNVAKELGVQYVLEGSVRKGGNRVRITAQLIDATRGNHIWAERYDRDLHDIFAVQDEITEAITGAVAPSFIAAEARRASAKAPENLDAWDLVMRGNWHLWRLTRADVEEAKQLFQEAIAIDPDSYMAHGGLGIAYPLAAGMGLAECEMDESREEGFKAARRAVALNDQDAQAHISLAMVLSICALDNSAALVSCRKALDLNPNFAFAEGLMGLVQAHLGDYDEANLHLDKATRLSPRDPALPWLGLARVIAPLVANLPEEYLDRAKELTDTATEFAAGWRHVAAAYMMQGRLEEAKAAIAQVLRLNPDDSLEAVRRSIPISNPDVREQFLAYLDKAGLPE